MNQTKYQICFLLFNEENKVCDKVIIKEDLLIDNINFAEELEYGRYAYPEEYIKYNLKIPQKNNHKWIYKLILIT